MENPDPYPSQTLLVNLLQIIVEEHNTSAAVRNIVVIFVLILLSAVVSGSESAFFSISNHQIKDLEQKKGGTYHLILKLLSRPKRLLATILIVNTIINIAIAILAAQLVEELMPQAAAWAKFAVEVGAVTLTLVLLGEITPKVYATQKNVQFAQFVAVPIRIMDFVFFPLSYLLTLTTKLLEGSGRKKGHNLKIEEIKQAIEITSDKSTTNEERKILQGVVAFSTTYVRQVMTSRVDIAHLDIKNTFQEVIDFINENRYSRIPVVNGNIDSVEGVVFIKDMVSFIGSAPDYAWQELIKPAFYIPESKMIDDLLTEFQKKKTHLAIVVDEYGGTSGIVTMEDILEEIVGDIKDEFDEDEITFTKLEDHLYIFNAKTSINDVIKILEIPDDSFEEMAPESETIGGVVLEIAKRVPKRGDVVESNGFRFTIENAERKKIKSIKMELLNHPSQSEEKES